MFWHIDTDIVALLVICALNIYTIRLLPQQKQSLQDRRFIWCLRAGIVVTIVDIAASVIMEEAISPMISPALYHLLMMLYYASIELVIIAWIYYAIAILYQGDDRRRKTISRFVIIPFVLYALLVFSNPWSGLFYTLSAGNAYSRGPLFFLMVAVFALYSILLFAIIIVRRKHIPAGYPSGVLLLIPLIATVSIAVQLLNPGWLIILPGYMVCLVLAFLFLQTNRIRNERAQLQQLTALVEHFSSGLAICEVTHTGELDVRYISNGLAAICDESSESLAARFREDMLTGVHPDDREMVGGNLKHLAKTHETHEMTYRFVTHRGNVKWINVKTQVEAHPDGSATVYATYTDLTKQQQAQQQLADTFQSVPCGICLYRWDGNSLHPIIANKQLAEILGLDAIDYLSGVSGLIYTHAHPDDRDRLREASQIGLTKTHKIDTTFRSLNFKTNEYVWIRMRGTMLPQPDGQPYVYVSYYDVTQEHLAAQKLRESEQALEYATEQAGLRYWRYDAINDRSYPSEQNQQEYGLPPVLDNFLTDWLPRLGILHPDYIETFRDACLRIKAGEKQVSFEARSYTGDKTPHWFRYCLTNLYDEMGMPTITVGTSVQIDAEKELWAKYELERNRKSVDAGHLLVHALFNLTTGETLEYEYQDGKTVPPEERTAFTYGQNNANLLINERERAQFLALNNKEALLQRFADGETEFRLDYRKRLPNGFVSWIRSTLHLVRDPRSADILLFEYWYDIEEEKMQELMYKSLSSDNYDYIARIDGRNKHFVMFPKAGLTYKMPPLSGSDADTVTVMLYGDGIMPEDRDAAIENSLVENIKKNLATQERFQFNYREIEPDGSIQYKRMTQSYLDPEREIILMTREDVTGIVKAEAERNLILSTALNAANQASQAKSQFLSRMSHELRTPMNAIIGLSALAVGEVNDPAAMESSISKIGMSARYLLSLINDILEMSRIESGRMTLNEGPFDFEELIATVNNIVYGQAMEKGLDYDAIVSSYTEPSYIGDATKLQQILVNVLGNAIKFTHEGGKVALNIEQLRKTGGRATLRFTVSDTGIGIGEEFLPHLFDAFAQESSSFTSTSTGTGLGLAITKNMVDMMGGQIHVQSIKNVGSMFTIELPLGITEDRYHSWSVLSSMNLSKLRALVVDDDVVICQTTEKALSDMGIIAEWADSGYRAIERVKECHASKADFDAIFVDWKMPEIDGIETTRQIRKVVGPEVTIIFMSTYDWRSIEAQAREAGVDMFIEKPLFRSSIRMAFEKIFTAKEEKIVERPRPEYDFTGRRILLAEDHPLNVEVAKRLLEKIGTEVYVVNNGLEATEAFSSAKPGFFDAILMDIRMPVMDGLAATKNIRNLKKADSQSVPIIAMTANAFDEDVELSISSGMNAHLNKPIEPHILFATLQRLMKE